MFSEQYEGEYHKRSLTKQTEERMLSNITNFINHIILVNEKDIVNSELEYSFIDRYGRNKIDRLTFLIYKEQPKENGIRVTFHNKTKTLFIIKEDI